METNLIKGNLNRRINETLKLLHNKNPLFNGSTIFKFYSNHQYFTPSQLVFIHSQAKKFKVFIPFDDFKTSLKYSNNKLQLYSMDSPKLKLLWPFLTDDQRLFYKENISC